MGFLQGGRERDRELLELVWIVASVPTLRVARPRGTALVRHDEREGMRVRFSSAVDLLALYLLLLDGSPLRFFMTTRTTKYFLSGVSLGTSHSREPLHWYFVACRARERPPLLLLPSGAEQFRFPLFVFG